MKFISAYALLIIATTLLCAVSFQLANIYPALSPLLYLQVLSISWNFALLGLGLGIITLIIAATMSWLQVALLITGNINPHMAEAGFIKALTTFWNVILGHG
tara:strand:+ start:12027 stop:12332 length:306 start_codon:yes stop_codon:yes gene_type:complete